MFTSTLLAALVHDGTVRYDDPVADGPLADAAADTAVPRHDLNRMARVGFGSLV